MRTNARPEWLLGECYVVVTPYGDYLVMWRHPLSLPLIRPLSPPGLLHPGDDRIETHTAAIRSIQEPLQSAKKCGSLKRWCETNAMTSMHAPPFSTTFMQGTNGGPNRYELV